MSPRSESPPSESTGVPVFATVVAACLEPNDRTTVITSAGWGRSPRLNVRETWVMVTWFALVVGSFESAWLAAQRYCFGEFLHGGSHIFWMCPALYVISAWCLCTPLFVLAWRTRYCTEDVVAMICLFLAAFSLLALIPGLAIFAQFILACGFTYQIGKWSEHRPGILIRWARASLAWLLLALTVTVVAVFQSQTFEHTLAAPRPAVNAPNILLLVMDTVRGDALHLDTSSDAGRTPNLYRLASEGFVFKRAYSTSPWTLPSHASMLTGRLPSEHSAGWDTPLSSEWPTITAWLSEKGYRTGAFVANHWYCTRETGLNRGFQYYDDEQVAVGNLIRSTAWGERFLPWMSCHLGLEWDYCQNGSRRSAALLRHNAVDWIKHDQSRPYFAMLNLFDAHDPYIAPPKFRRSVLLNEEQEKRQKADLLDWWGMDKQQVTDDLICLQYAAYQDCVAYLDYEIGRLLDELKQAGALDNTLVIVTSDHGEHFGDHQLYGHGNSLYEALIHVPLIVWRQGGNRLTGISNSAISLRELPATIASQVAPIERHPFPGNSWEQFWNAEDVVESPVFSEIRAPSHWPSCGGRSPVFRGAMQSVVWQGLKYIHNGDGVEEIYRLAHDPDERKNLAASVDQEQLLAFRRLILSASDDSERSN